MPKSSCAMIANKLATGIADTNHKAGITIVPSGHVSVKLAIGYDPTSREMAIGNIDRYRLAIHCCPSCVT